MFVTLIEESYMNMKFESTYDYQYQQYNQHSNMNVNESQSLNKAKVYDGFLIQDQNLNNFHDIFYPEHQFLKNNFAD